jgi:hypothetical protein
MGRSAAVAFFVASGALCGCASPDARHDDSLNIVLTAARINAGETGRAILVPLGERTQVTVIVSGVPVELASRPVHLYTFVYNGTCGNSAGQPAYALTGRVLAQSATSTVGGAFTITNVAPVSMDALRSEAHSIRVKTSPADGDREIFCGDIR